jgi:integrase
VNESQERHSRVGCTSLIVSGRRLTPLLRTRRGSRRSSPSCAKRGSGAHADRVRGLIAILWRAGLRISEALALTESDLDSNSGSVLVRCGKGGKCRHVGMDNWGWEHLNTWIQSRVYLPVGPLFCILDGPTRGRGWSATGARAELQAELCRVGLGS